MEIKVGKLLVQNRTGDVYVITKIMSNPGADDYIDLMCLEEPSHEIKQIWPDLIHQYYKSYEVCLGNQNRSAVEKESSN